MAAFKWYQCSFPGCGEQGWVHAGKKPNPNNLVKPSCSLNNGLPHQWVIMEDWKNKATDSDMYPADKWCIE